jgi:hypothetical protein
MNGPVIEHWVCQTCGALDEAPTRRSHPRLNAPDLRCHGPVRLEGFVPVSQLQGAVEAARDADVASMQAAFWRARAIELGADPGEWAKRDREVFGGQ